MLILTRKRGQALYINDDITITVREVGNDNVRLAIDAPKEVKILREELVEAMKQNMEAAGQKDVDLSALKDAFIPRG